MEVGDSGACGIGLPEGIRVRAANNHSAAGYPTPISPRNCDARFPYPKYSRARVNVSVRAENDPLDRGAGILSNDNFTIQNGNYT